jgi:hypothetical protein
MKRLSRLGATFLIVLTGMATATATASASPSEPERTLLAEAHVTYSVPATAADGSQILATCTLNGTIWKTVVDHIEAWGNTECNTTVASINHDMRIQRSRWFGWETMAERNGDTKFNSSWHSTKLDYNCWRTGIHDFRALIDGVAIPFGENPQLAHVEPRTNDVNCG